MIATPPFTLTRAVFLRLLSACYFVAFASSFVQFRGLVGSFQALGPAPPPKAGSVGAWLCTGLGLDWWTAMDLVHVLGLALAGALVALPSMHGCGSVVLMGALPGLYMVVMTVAAKSSTFFNFQWDILLVEAGVVGALWGGYGGEDDLEPSNAVRWALRFLAFKLMFMSGVVKVISGDETWITLNALKYHFASQPLPTPLAPLAHWLTPDWALRLGVAGTFLIEIWGAYLILVPTRGAARLAFLANTALMLAIALTGNYNFFNALTVVLMVPLLDLSTHPPTGMAVVEALVTMASVLVVCGLALRAFEVDWQRPPSKWFVSPAEKNFPLLRVKPDALAAELRVTLPLCVGWTLALVAMHTVRDVYMAFKYSSDGKDMPVKLGLGVLSLFYVASSAVPLAGLDRGVFQHVPKVVQDVHFLTKDVVFGYGLFRTMTGVASDGSVAVPTLVMRGRRAAAPWERLSFDWYHGEPLGVTWGHQPRLDWQMWFAALGEPERNHFVKQLLARLLTAADPDEEVWGLMKGLGASAQQGWDEIDVRRVHLQFAPLSRGTTTTVWVRHPADSSGDGTKYMSMTRTEAKKFVDLVSETMAPRSRYPSCAASLQWLCGDVKKQSVMARFVSGSRAVRERFVVGVAVMWGGVGVGLMGVRGL